MTGTIATIAASSLIAIGLLLLMFITIKIRQLRKQAQEDHLFKLRLLKAMGQSATKTVIVAANAIKADNIRAD